MAMVSRVWVTLTYYFKVSHVMLGNWRHFVNCRVVMLNLCSGCNCISLFKGHVGLLAQEVESCLVAGLLARACVRACQPASLDCSGYKTLV